MPEELRENLMTDYEDLLAKKDDFDTTKAEEHLKFGSRTKKICKLYTIHITRIKKLFSGVKVDKTMHYQEISQWIVQSLVQAWDENVKLLMHLGHRQSVRLFRMKLMRFLQS